MSFTTSRSRLFSQIIWTSILLALSRVSSAAQTAPRALIPVDAVQGIVAAFQQHPVVIIGEAHWLRQAGDFYVRLVRDPAFQEIVQDIVVEFASRNNQPLLDRYIDGEDVPLEDVRRIWRDTTGVASWESPIYAEWLAAIREVNKKLPPPHRLRVVAGDTAIDWRRMHTHSDWAALGDNNVSFAEVIVNQVLEKNRRAVTEPKTLPHESNLATPAPRTSYCRIMWGRSARLLKTCSVYRIEVGRPSIRFPERFWGNPLIKMDCP